MNFPSFVSKYLLSRLEVKLLSLFTHVRPFFFIDDHPVSKRRARARGSNIQTNTFVVVLVEPTATNILDPDIKKRAFRVKDSDFQPY